jgi:hypothetical protein
MRGPRLEALMPDEHDEVRWVNVFIDDVLVCQIGVHADPEAGPTNIVAFPNGSWNRTTITESLLRDYPLEPLYKVIKLIPEVNEEMPLVTLPQYRREYLAGAPNTHHRALSEGGEGDRIYEALRDELIVAILDSHLDEPNQSKKRTAEITEQLVTKLNAAKWTIAGVRAAMTRGVYGSKDVLLQERAKQRARSAQRTGHIPTATVPTTH